ncbi:hypothetical protein [Aquabacterium sp.]|uniref:hypothetical protein n=1 Tax=Aquabacterium sp. TaxID=1872578 RepID=UPI00378320D6
MLRDVQTASAARSLRWRRLGESGGRWLRRVGPKLLAALSPGYLWHGGGWTP